MTDTLEAVIAEMRAAAAGLEHGPGSGLAVLAFADRLAALDPAPSSHLEVVKDALEERDDALEKYRLLAEEMVYEGNSVNHWKVRADARSQAIDLVFAALREFGIESDGKTHVADLVRRLAALPKASGEPVATVRVWHKDGDQHAQLLDWEVGIDKLADGEHKLYVSPQPTAPAGWKLVPVENLNQMVERIRSLVPPDAYVRGAEVRKLAEMIESAMLAVAPEPKA